MTIALPIRSRLPTIEVMAYHLLSNEDNSGRTLDTQLRETETHMQHLKQKVAALEAELSALRSSSMPSLQSKQTLQIRAPQQMSLNGDELEFINTLFNS